MRPASFAALGLALGACAKPRPAAPAPAPVLDARAVVAGVERAYRDAPTVHAAFEQTSHDLTFGTVKADAGEVWLARPGKMRWDYRARRSQKGVDRTVIVDGSAASSTVPEAIERLAAMVAFAIDDLDDFDAHLDDSGAYGGAGDVVLALTPRTAGAPYRALYLVVGDRSLVEQSILVDEHGNEQRIRFTAQEAARGIDDVFERDRP